MKLIRARFEVIDAAPNDVVLRRIEMAGRTCYKSEDRMNEESGGKFVKMLVSKGHHAMIEHSGMTLRIICDRGVTHEIVRHRMASYAQESTRYCDYKGEMEFIIPCWWPEIPEGSFDILKDHLSDPEQQVWVHSMGRAEQDYKLLRSFGLAPQAARSILPNSLKTEIVITANMREWMHIFRLRCDKTAHPQMREIMGQIYYWAKNKYPEIFGGIFDEHQDT